MIAYCPLDLPKLLINEQKVNDLIENYNPGHHDKLWETLPLLGRVEKQDDFFDAAKFEIAWEKRYEKTGNVLINQKIAKEIPELFTHLKKLPMKVTHAQILRAIKNIPKHFDMKHKNKLFIDDFPEINYEPNGFKILLNKFDHESFYICKSWDSPPTFIHLPNDTNTFCINEKTFPHGSKFVEGKCIVSIFGLVDKEKAEKLISDSLKKYKDFVVNF